MKISNEVMVVLSRVEVDGNKAVITDQLERKTYVKVDEVLQAIGGKWNRKARAHTFDGDAQERIDTVLATGEVTTHRDLGFFQTPVPLAKLLIERIDPDRYHRCLEPSAGTGRLVEAMLDREVEGPIVVVEYDDKMRAALVARKDRRILVLDTPDFMRVHAREAAIFNNPPVPIPPRLFDRIAMNPPFIKVGKGDHIDHVRLAHSLLAPDGILGAILPASVRFREDKRHREFRDWAELVGRFEDLPDGSFAESGTGVRTCMFVTNKR